LQAIKDTDVEVRRSAATALGSMKSEASTVIPVLIRSLNNEEEDEEVRLTAAHSLGRFRQEAKTAVPYLLECLTGKSGRVAHWAALALGQIGPVDGTVLPGLIEALKNEQAVFAATAALGQIGKKAKAAVPALIEIVRSSKVKSPSGLTARECAIGALGGIGRPALPAVPILLDILKNTDRDTDLRVSAAIALSNIDPESDETKSALGAAAKESGHLAQVAGQMLEKIKMQK
jgi:HEAT repeat protein